MSGKPSRKLTLGPILLLTLSDIAYACTGSLQVVSAPYQTELVITIPLSAFQRNFTSWRVYQTLCYVQHIHTSIMSMVTSKPNFYFQTKFVNNYMYISIKFCASLLIQDQGYLISDYILRAFQAVPFSYYDLLHLLSLLQLYRWRSYLTAMENPNRLMTYPPEVQCRCIETFTLSSSGTGQPCNQ